MALEEPPMKCVARLCPRFVAVEASLLFFGDSKGGENGPESWAVPRSKLALFTLAFSSRSALKKKSRGDSSRCVSGGEIRAIGGVGELLLLEEESSLFVVKIPLVPGESGTDFEKKLGIGRAEGAGEA
jgi:hypothetical protein